jgi:hypothetical protein
MMIRLSSTITTPALPFQDCPQPHPGNIPRHILQIILNPRLAAILFGYVRQMRIPEMLRKRTHCTDERAPLVCAGHATFRALVAVMGPPICQSQFLLTSRTFASNSSDHCANRAGLNQLRIRRATNGALPSLAFVMHHSQIKPGQHDRSTGLIASSWQITHSTALLRSAWSSPSIPRIRSAGGT